MCGAALIWECLGEYQGVKSCRAFLRYCMVKAKRRSEEIAYKVYVTDTLKMIAESAAGGERRYTAARFYDTLNLRREKEDDREPEEIIKSVLNGLKRLKGEEK